VGIRIRLNTLSWDATNPDTTAGLVDEWFRNSLDSREYLAVVANFSGEAGRGFGRFARSFQHIDERLHDKQSTIVWVEPGMPGARSFLQRIQGLFSRRQPDGSQSAYEYFWYHPLQARRLPCSVLVYRYKRS